jgi:hypothetical protein
MQADAVATRQEGQFAERSTKEKSWFDRQFADASWGLYVLPIIFNGLALLMGVLGIVFCKHPGARRNAKLLTILGGTVTAVGGVFLAIAVYTGVFPSRGLAPEIPRIAPSPPDHGQSGAMTESMPKQSTFATIHDAVKSGQVSAVKRYLEASPKALLARDSQGQTPLHHAAHGDHLEIARFLLAEGAEINALDNMGNTPMDLVSVELVGSRLRPSPVGIFLLQEGAKPGRDLKPDTRPSTVRTQESDKPAQPPGTAEGVAHLLNRIKTGDLDAASEAAYQLGVMGSAAIPSLAELVLGDDKRAAGIACFALGKVGNEGVPLLQVALLHEDSDVRRAATTALSAVKVDPKVAQLVRAYKEGNESQRRDIAQSLGKLGSQASSALPELYASLAGRGLVLGGGPQDPYVEDVTAAIAAIAKGNVVYLAHALFKRKEGQQALLLVILKVGDNAVPPLCSFVSPTHDAKTCEWAMAWIGLIEGQIAGNRAIAVSSLEAAREHPDQQVRENAKKLLAKMMGEK